MSRRLPAEPGSIPEARAAIAAMGEEVGMDAIRLVDLKVVVTEACTNVVRHAYPGGGGEFELEAVPKNRNMRVMVRDFGQGILPEIRLDRDSLQLGIGLMSALSSHFEIDGAAGSGTCVIVEIPLH